MSLLFSLRSSENVGWKVGKKPLFLTFHVFCFVHFQEKNLHFAPFSLSRLLACSYFFKPRYTHLAPKTTYFNGYFAPFRHVFHGFKRFWLYNCCVCLCFLSRILQHLSLRLAAKRTAFSGILPCVLHQSAVHFASKHTPFCCKTHSILQQIAPK